MHKLLAEIIGADDLKREEITEIVKPEWKLSEPIYVRVMQGFERERLEERIQDNPEKSIKGLKQMLVGMTLVDASNKTLCENGDARELFKKSAAVINRVADVALRLNGFTDKDVKELAKN